MKMQQNQQHNQLSNVNISDTEKPQHISKSDTILEELESLNTFSIIIVIVFVLSACLLMSYN